MSKDITRRTKRRVKKVRIHYPRLVFSLIAIVLILFLFLSLINALIARMKGSDDVSGESTQPPVTNVDTATTDKINNELDLVVRVIEKKSTVPILHSFESSSWSGNVKATREELLQVQNKEAYAEKLKEWIRSIGDYDTNVLSEDQLNNLIVQGLLSPSATNPSLLEQPLRSLSPQNKPIESGDNLLLDTPSNGKVATITVNSFDPSHIETDRSVIENFVQGLRGYEKIILDVRKPVGGLADYWIEVLVKPLAKADLNFIGRILVRDKGSLNDVAESLKLLPDAFTVSEWYPINEFPTDVPVSPVVLKKFASFCRYDVTVPAQTKSDLDAEIYLWVDQESSPITDLFVQFANHTNFATTIGQPTSGGGINTFVDPMIEHLPYSGQLLTYPSTIGISSDGVLSDMQPTPVQIELSGNLSSMDEVIRQLP